MTGAPTREFAVRFDPPNHGHRVPLDVYAPAMSHLARGFAALRAAVAPMIARRLGLPKAEVADALVIHVRATAQGSLLNPLDIGPKEGEGQGNIPFTPSNLPALFWKWSGGLLRSVSQEAPRITEVHLSAACIEHFSSAGDIAGKHGFRLQLASRHTPRTGRAVWRTTFDVTAERAGLQRYIAKRRETFEATTQLIGTIVEICSEPLQFKLDTVDGRVPVAADVGLKDDIRVAWGRAAVVTVRARMNRDGGIEDAKAIQIEKVIQSSSLLADYESSRGAGSGLWSSHEAEDYLSSLRRGSA